MDFAGFEEKRVKTGECEIFARVGGEGPPLLLLHGYPQCSFMWHRMAAPLAERFSVVVPDLRGYGASGKPAGGDRHEGYGKRAMARDQAELMTALGHDRFMVAGHDRGGRVAHRMCLDHAERVAKVCFLDIVPTRRVFADTDQALATAYYHWFFLIQKAPYPETLIGQNAEYYLRTIFSRWGPGKSAVSEPAFAEYLSHFQDPETIHATCEDYRAGASIDLEHDQADQHKKVTCPVLALWGEQAVMHKRYDVVGVWRGYAHDVRGHAVDCGHFLPEEAPEATLSAFLEFFDDRA